MRKKALSAALLLMNRGSSTARLLRRISAVGRGSKEHPILRCAYRALVGTEIVAARAAALGRRVRPVDPGNLTLVIKTFERPELLSRLLRSARRVFSGAIIIADDSETPFVCDDSRVTVLALPFDSGVGAGRNALIDAVTSEYLMMCDDDMVLLPGFDVRRPLEYLARNRDVDLCGGEVIDLPRWKRINYTKAPLFASTGRPRWPQGTVLDGLPVLYKVPNFYVARTDRVRQVRYDDKLKRVDHADFFTRAFGKLTCVYDSNMVCLHSGSLFDARYQSFRMDMAEDSAYLVQKWSLGR